MFTSATTVRVLGIDPGIGTTGYAVVDCGDGSPRAVEYGAITTPSSDPVATRLRMLHSDLQVLIERFRPRDVAIEQLFVHRNLKTVIAVGQARGVVLLGAEQNMLGVAEYTPPQVKSAVCGTGRAGKSQVQDMVTRLFGLPQRPTPDDVADALAIAWCHTQSRSFWDALSLKQQQ